MNLLERVQPWIDWLKRAVTDPRGELTRWQRTARYLYDLGRFGARQLRQDKAPQMAGALAFRTLFGLLPVFVVVTVLIRAFQGSEQFMDSLAEFFTSIGLDDQQVVAADVTGHGEMVSMTLSEWLLDLLAQAQSLNIAAIGWVGVIILIYSAIGLMVTIENSFNTVYRAPEGRAWTWRVPIYWTVLTLGPIALLGVWFLSGRSTLWLSGFAPVWVISVAPSISGFLGAWVIMFTIYWLVPSTDVSVRPALVGAFVTAVLVEIGRRSLGVYLDTLASVQNLYGSLGLIPLFMFWVYVMWLVVLFGLEVAATLQMLRGSHRLDEIQRRPKPSGVVEPAAVVQVMEVVAAGFESGRVTTARQLTETTGVPEATIRRMLGALGEAGFLHTVDRESGAVTLARPPGQITAAALMEVGFGLVETGAGHPSELVERLRQAQKTLAAQLTLGSALKPAPAESR